MTSEKQIKSNIVLELNAVILFAYGYKVYIRRLHIALRFAQKAICILDVHGFCPVRIDIPPRFPSSYPQKEMTRRSLY